MKDNGSGRRASAEPALVADATGAASVSAHSGDGQAQGEVATELQRIFDRTNSYDPKAVIRGHNPGAAWPLIPWRAVEERNERLKALLREARPHVAYGTAQADDKGRAEAQDLLRRLDAAASADTHPQGGDSAQTEAPFMSGAVPSEETADAQTPSRR